LALDSLAPSVARAPVGEQEEEEEEEAEEPTEGECVAAWKSELALELEAELEEDLRAVNGFTKPPGVVVAGRLRRSDALFVLNEEEDEEETGAEEAVRLVFASRCKLCEAE
jgi:hypothetical protein